MTHPRKSSAWLAGALIVAATLAPLSARAQEKVILDTDFNVLGDDGQVFIMAAQLDIEGTIDLLGLTMVSGNQWHDQGMVDALKAVERMQVADRIKVYPGSQYPLVHDQATYEAEKALFGRSYAGAWQHPKPTPADLKAPPDGMAEHAQPADQHAIDFIIEQVEIYPHEVTLLVIGPVTNIALAVRKDPDIVPLIKRIVYMGGAVGWPGNVTPAAEFNWWFDPEAAKIVLREPIPQAIIPLDVTNTVTFGKQQYDRIVNDSVPATPVTALFQNRFETRFKDKPDHTTYLWDTVAMAYLVDPSLATDVRQLEVDVDDTFGPNYGRSIGYYRNAPQGALEPPEDVVFRIDNERFFDLYTDLMTRPIK